MDLRHFSPSADGWISAKHDPGNTWKDFAQMHAMQQQNALIPFSYCNNGIRLLGANSRMRFVREMENERDKGL